MNTIGFVRDQIEMKDVYINEGSGGGGFPRSKFLKSMKLIAFWGIDMVMIPVILGQTTESLEDEQSL